MTIEFEYDSGLHRLSVCGDLTIYHTADIKQALLEKQGINLDLSRVGEIDGAGLQLLLLAVREVQAHVCAVSDAVTDALRLTGLSHLAEGTS